MDWNENWMDVPKYEKCLQKDDGTFQYILFNFSLESSLILLSGQWRFTDLWNPV